MFFARARASCMAESRGGSAARQVLCTSSGTGPTAASNRHDDGDEGNDSWYTRSGVPWRGTRSGRSVSASAHAAASAASVPAVQSSLCFFQWLDLALAAAVLGGLANRAGLELDAVGARVVGGAAVGADVWRHDAAHHVAPATLPALARRQ